jgi:hypothetical protein
VFVRFLQAVSGEEKIHYRSETRLILYLGPRTKLVFMLFFYVFFSLL